MKIQRYWTDCERSFLTDNYGKLPTKEIAIKLDRTYQSVKSMATKIMKLDYGSICKNSLLPLMEDTNFNWYWLGFIAGDGYIENDYLTMSLHMQDIEHLKLLSTYLGANINFSKAGYPVISISDKCGISDLRLKIGHNGSAKTYNPLNIDYDISDENMWSFIFGFIDADGCIEVGKNMTAKQLKIEVHSSWLDNLNKISAFLLMQMNIPCRVYINKRGYALLRITKHSNIQKLKEKMISLDIPFLGRKWDKIADTPKGQNFFREIQDEIIERFKKGQNLHSIAKELGVNRGSLYNHIDEIKTLANCT